MKWGNILGHGWLPPTPHPTVSTLKSTKQRNKNKNCFVCEEASGVLLLEEGNSDSDSRWLQGSMVAHLPMTEAFPLFFRAQSSLAQDSKAADLLPREPSLVLENHVFLIKPSLIPEEQPWTSIPKQTEHNPVTGSVLSSSAPWMLAPALGKNSSCPGMGTEVSVWTTLISPCCWLMT